MARFFNLSRTGKAVACFSCWLLLTGCAAIPDVSVAYRPVKWTIPVSIAYTITCTFKKDFAIIQRGATVSPIYAAGPDNPAFRIRLAELNRFFSDAEMSFSFTEDGRLKSINQSTTGQGELVVKSAVATLGALAALAPVKSSSNGIQLYSNDVPQGEVKLIDPKKLCEVVQKFNLTASGQFYQVSLAKVTELNEGELNREAKNPSDQEDLNQALKEAGFSPSAFAKGNLGTDELQPIESIKPVDQSSEVPLTLQRMVTLTVTVDDSLGPPVTRAFPVPITKTFTLPIPKAALFGKQSFALSLSESGRITTIGYVKTTGVPGALNAAGALASAEVTRDNAEAAALKAAADLIAQQQRYIRCKFKEAEDCK
jgi:hypothetical protein